MPGPTAIDNCDEQFAQLFREVNLTQGFLVQGK